MVALRPAMSSLQRDQSDSEDDGDYVPPAREQQGSDVSEDESRYPEQANELSAPTPADLETKQKGRDVLWASFQASVASSSSEKPKKFEEIKKVKIQKTYLFAGEYITEVIEVPEDSLDAKKWPRYQEYEEKTDSEESTAVPTAPSMAVPGVPGPCITTGSATPPKLPLKKPGPRKPKTLLNTLPPSQKAKKLTTLDKSLMDWKAHTTHTSLQDELDANRKGGGYLEKVEFLKRVEERKEDNLEVMKSRKRRKL